MKNGETAKFVIYGDGFTIRMRTKGSLECGGQNTSAVMGVTG